MADDPLPLHTQPLPRRQKSETGGKYLAAFYKALGLDPAKIAAGPYEIDHIGPGAVIVRYPGTVMVTEEQLSKALLDAADTGR